jgi:hypothetical protein
LHGIPATEYGGWPLESRNGRFLYYGGRGATVWKAPSSGGSPTLLALNGKGPFFESGDGKFLYFGGPDTSIWRAPTAGGQAAPVLKIGRRANWVILPAGMCVLDPDAVGGPAIELVRFAGGRKQVVRLPGPPDGYVDPSSGELIASPDGKWLFYLYSDKADSRIMLVENFR